MQGIKLSPGIRYIAMEDEEGPLGVMTLLPSENWPVRAVSIESREDFKYWFNQFSTFENHSDVRDWVSE
jgi:hypothetical protein|tara:strand:- start:961 stop:1167 length:207 start_codon:yes stop_codon:yes gene_type:complete